MENIEFAPFPNQTNFISSLVKFVNHGCLNKSDILLASIFPRLTFYKNAPGIIKMFLKSHRKKAETLQTILIPPYEGQHKKVKAIECYIDKNLRKEVLVALVHGSIASEEIIPYSDFDALVILRNDVFTSPSKLAKTAIHLSNCYSMMMDFDPLQHHGWFVMSESDLFNYPSNYFPIDILKFSKSLTGNVHLKIYTDNVPLKNDTLNHVLVSLSLQLKTDYIPQNLYIAKGLLSEFMLLPALFIQAKTGKSVFKKFSFELASKFFTLEEWKIMNEVSQIRSEWVTVNQNSPFKTPCIITPLMKKRQKKMSGQIPVQLASKFKNGLAERMVKFIVTIQKKINE